MKRALVRLLAIALVAAAPQARARPPSDPSGPIYDWTDDLGHEHHTHRKPTASMMAAGLRAPRAHAPRTPRARTPHSPKLHVIRPPRLPATRLPRLH